LKLTNPTDRRICFKIKTTAPKRYCVRPNAGILDPGSHLSIAVVFQPCELEPTANRHKFMVQAIFAPEGDINQDDLWKSTASVNVMETKLRCSFDNPGEAVEATVAHEQHVIPVTEEKVVRKHEEKPHRSGADDGDARNAKQENAKLKDEVERLRRQLKARMDAGDPMMRQGIAAPPSQAMLYVVLTIVVAIVGIVLGKFVL